MDPIRANLDLDRIYHLERLSAKRWAEHSSMPTYVNSTKTLKGSDPHQEVCQKKKLYKDII